MRAKNVKSKPGQSIIASIIKDALKRPKKNIKGIKYIMPSIYIPSHKQNQRLIRRWVSHCGQKSNNFIIYNVIIKM